MTAAWLPLLRWWPRVNAAALRADAVAGLTGGIGIVPQGVAFATIAGMPPEYGLYAAMLPAIVAALWGSSWHLVSGPTTAISIVVFATISPFATPGSDDDVRLVLSRPAYSSFCLASCGSARWSTSVAYQLRAMHAGRGQGQRSDAPCDRNCPRSGAPVLTLRWASSALRHPSGQRDFAMPCRSALPTK